MNLDNLAFKAKEDSFEVKNYKYYLQSLMTFEECVQIREELQSLIYYENKEILDEDVLLIKQENFIFNYIKLYITETDRNKFKDWLLAYDNGCVKVNHKANTELFKTLLKIKERYWDNIETKIIKPMMPIQICIIQLNPSNNEKIGRYFLDYDYNAKYMIYNTNRKEEEETKPVAYEKAPKRRY
jgi:hypothetical protein